MGTRVFVEIPLFVQISGQIRKADNTLFPFNFQATRLRLEILESTSNFLNGATNSWQVFAPDLIVTFAQGTSIILQSRFSSNLQIIPDRLVYSGAAQYRDIPSGINAEGTLVNPINIPFSMQQYQDLIVQVRNFIKPGFIFGTGNVPFQIKYDDETTETIVIPYPSILFQDTAQYLPLSRTVVIPDGSVALIDGAFSQFPPKAIFLLSSFNIKEDNTIDLAGKSIIVAGKRGILLNNQLLTFDNITIVEAKLTRITQVEPPPLGGGDERFVCICGQLIPRSQVFFPEEHCKRYSRVLL